MAWLSIFKVRYLNNNIKHTQTEKLMEIYSGTITQISDGGSKGKLKEDHTENEVNFYNPRIPHVAVDNRVDYLKVVQNTPNGEEVVNILRNKKP